jgi:membrane-anchored protein YejM (alkaline phosphatase superfamily)
MKAWLVAGCFVTAYVIIPVIVHWMRHRPHRLTEPTQHIVLTGLLLQVLLVFGALLIWWLV